MKRTTIGALCLLMLCALTVPAFALETKLSGFYNLRAISDNFAARNNYIASLDDQAKTDNVVDQRLRMKLDSKVNEYLGFTYYGEVDMQWGDTSYSGSPGRNDGGAIGGDTTNVETKNIYVDINVPEKDTAFRVGLQGFADNYNYTLFGADMAGIKVKTTLGAADLTAGWFKLIEGGFEQSDDVNLWAVQTRFAPSEDLMYGFDYYFYNNQGSQEYATFFGTADIAAVLFDDGAGNAGTGTWTKDRSDMKLHYIGGHADFKVGGVTLNGWLNANIGSVDNLTINSTSTDVDVQGFAGSVKASTELNGIKFNVRGTFFSGDDDLSDGDANFVVNPLATESFAFATDGFMIMTPDIGWNSVGQYGFAMVDAAWAGYGLFSVNLTAKYKPTAATYIKGGVGYFSSLEDTVKDDRTSRKGTNLGTEFFLRAGVKVFENLDLSLNGAYATLGDFYDNNGGGKAVNKVTTDIDDPFEVYAKMTLSF